MDINKDKDSRLDQFAANPQRALWMLATPMMLGMMVQTIYTIVDMIFDCLDDRSSPRPPGFRAVAI